MKNKNLGLTALAAIVLPLMTIGSAAVAHASPEGERIPAPMASGEDEKPLFRTYRSDLTEWEEHPERVPADAVISIRTSDTGLATRAVRLPDGIMYQTQLSRGNAPASENIGPRNAPQELFASVCTYSVSPMAPVRVTSGVQGQVRFAATIDCPDGAVSWRGGLEREACGTVGCTWRERTTNSGAISPGQTVTDTYLLECFPGTNSYRAFGAINLGEQPGPVRSTTC